MSLIWITFERIRGVLLAALCVLVLVTDAEAADDTISLNLRDVSIAEAMEMISRKQRLNILLGDSVKGKVSLNLYSVSVEEAIRSIADAAGYAVEQRRGSWFIMEHSNVGQYSSGDLTQAERFYINYADPVQIGEMLQPHLSRYGKMTVIPERNMLIITDKQEFLDRAAELIQFVDTQPQQVLIEAQILEVTLSDEDSYGIDWAKLFSSDGGEGRVAGRGLSGVGGSGASGFLFELLTPNVDLTLTALNEDGRVRTLSTPKLLALDNQEASVIIGDRRGYAVTTTINQVTTESIEFLESGVILRVTPHIDADGRVLMEIHPEVSTGSVDANGIPSQATTEVETSLLVDDGQTVFIGGLMKHTANESYQRVPLLGRTPVLRRLFTNRERTNVNTETIVLIKPQVVTHKNDFSNAPARRYDHERLDVQGEVDKIEAVIENEKALPKVLPFLEPPRATGAAMDYQGTGYQGLDNQRTAPEVSHPDEKTVSTTDSTGFVAVEPLELINDSEASVIPDSFPTLDFPDHYYTVQLMAMADRGTMNDYLSEHGINGLSTVEVFSGGRSRVALLLGFFDSREAAEEASRHVPDALSGVTPWVRSLASIKREQQQLAALHKPGPAIELVSIAD